MRVANLAAALVVCAALLYVSFFGAGPLPALGPAFNPQTGAWTMAADAADQGPQTWYLGGLQQRVEVVLEEDGTAHITASTDHDLFLATGYIHARFRLFQMDLERRQGEGRLAEVIGSSDALANDRFELELGLLRTAQEEWAQLPAGDETRAALEAYSQGVNDRIREAEVLHELPAMFTLLGYQPKPWTPIDSLIIKGDLTLMESFTDTPLVMALLEKSLGPDLTSEWFPVLPPNPQSPYDPGPYAQRSGPAPIGTVRAMSSDEADSMAALYERLSSLPAGLIAHGGDSNNWAVAGSKSSTGGALMAGDPHLHLTLPAIWFQLSLDSPGYHTSGVSVPGTPVVLIGHNQHISWSLTDAQNQQTLFYEEKEDGAHPGRYFWNGAWRKYSTVSYDIPVRGSSPDRLTVKLSVHGPVISERGLTTSVWWAGNLPSHDLRDLMDIGRASNFQEFRTALSDWRGSAHNFVYADDEGNIGLISAGLYPQVAKGEPWLPMPGTGEYDVTGTIPFDDVPQIYDPPTGYVWSANQRQVAGDYPYYVGTASNFFDPGYRANEINRFLGQDKKFTVADMEALQNDTRDYLASEMVPALLQALNGEQLDVNEQNAQAALAAWDYRMEIGSAAATIWSTFWDIYLGNTFDPWWTSHNVKVHRRELDESLGQDLEAWTLHDQTNPAFTLIGSAQNAQDVMKQSLHATVKLLAERLGTDTSTWAWGRIHQRTLENLAQITGLNYGPRPDRGDSRTPLAAAGFPSTHGPSWRIVVDWGAKTFEGIYPGGQSENPASSWYDNRVEAWWDGRYAPMLSAEAARSQTGAVIWRLRVAS